MVDDYLGYSTFTDVDNNLLRAWNRIKTAVNLLNTHDKETSEGYMALFRGGERTAIFLLTQEIKTKGADNVKKQILKLTQQ